MYFSVPFPKTVNVVSCSMITIISRLVSMVPLFRFSTKRIYVPAYVLSSVLEICHWPLLPIIPDYFSLNIMSFTCLSISTFPILMVAFLFCGCPFSGYSFIFSAKLSLCSIHILTQLYGYQRIRCSWFFLQLHVRTDFRGLLVIQWIVGQSKVLLPHHHVDR